jgi:hypothetical protein
LQRILSLVLLNDLGWPKLRIARIATEFFKGTALAQQIPILIKLDLDFLEPLLIGIRWRVMLIKALLFRHQFPNVVEHRSIGRADLRGRMFVCHLQFSEQHVRSNEG